MLNFKKFYNSFLAILLGAGLAIASVSIIAAPQGGEVQSGDITIGSDTASGIDTLITQTTQKEIIDWESFNIAFGEHTHFAQPGIDAITLNRILSRDPSSIFGKLTATGKIWLINPAGILFGPNARVDVSGLLATTANISNKAGNYYFMQGPGSGKIINKGLIRVADNGLVFLVAPGVENYGIIQANLGTVALAST